MISIEIIKKTGSQRCIVSRDGVAGYYFMYDATRDRRELTVSDPDLTGVVEALTTNGDALALEMAAAITATGQRIGRWRRRNGDGWVGKMPITPPLAVGAQFDAVVTAISGKKYTIEAPGIAGELSSKLSWGDCEVGDMVRVEITKLSPLLLRQV